MKGCAVQCVSNWETACCAIYGGKCSFVNLKSCTRLWMEKWLEIPKDRTRLPVGRLCLILALTILLLFVVAARKATVLADIGAAFLGFT